MKIKILILLIIIGIMPITATAQLAESYHPYANNYDNIWTISEPGVSQMRLHFNKIEIKNYDTLRILDKNNNQIKNYGNINQMDVWTEWFTGDTFKIQLITNGDDQGYGFLIDSKETKAGTPTPTPTYTATPTPTSTPTATPIITPTYTTPAPSPTPTFTLTSISNVAFGKPVSLTTNGVDDGHVKEWPSDITSGVTDGSLNYLDYSESVSHSIGWVNNNYNEKLIVTVTIDLQGTYNIQKIRYNMGNVQRAETWGADIMESPFGRTQVKPGKPYSGVWTEQTGNIIASSVIIKFEKTRTSWETDLFWIGEIEVYGTSASMPTPTYTYTSQTPATPDASPPAISLSKQIVDFNNNGQLEEGEKLDITFGATDESGVKSIKVLVDGNLIDLRNSQGTYSVTTDSLSMGDHSIVVEAMDSKGNKKSEKMNITAARLGPSVYFPKSRYEVNEGDDFDVVLSAVNPIGNPKMDSLLILKPPGNGVSTYESDCKGFSGQCTGKFEIQPGDSVRSVSTRIRADRAGEYQVDAEVYYQFENGQRSPTRYETLTVVVKPKQTTTPINMQVPKTSGFEILLALAGVMSAFYLHLMKSRK